MNTKELARRVLLSQMPRPNSLTTRVRIVMFPKTPDGTMSDNGYFLTWRKSDGNWPNFVESVFTALGNPKIDYAYVEYMAGKTLIETHTLKGTPNSPHIVTKKT